MIYNRLKLLKKENDSLAKQLDMGLQNEIRTMVKYVRSNGLGMYETEIFRKDLIGMSQEAHIRGETLYDILDSPSQDFCDRVLECRMKKRSESVLYILYNFSIMMLFYSFVQPILFGYSIPINTSFLLIAGLYLTGSWMGLCLDKYYIQTGWKACIPYLCPMLVWGIIIVFSLYLRNHYTLKLLFTIGWLPLVLIHFTLFLILRLMWNRQIDRAAKRNAG